MEITTSKPVAVTEISKEVLDVLFADLKGAVADGGWMEGNYFRYEMFARRLVAAEYGRQDAVKWALEWHADLQKERAERLRVQQEQIAQREAQLQHGRAELAAGRCGNPLYQAFLDTTEEPASLKDNVPYFTFHSRMMAEFNKHGEGVTFLQFVRNYADQHLAVRLKRQKQLH